jgi:hypothetical protein
MLTHRSRTLSLAAGLVGSALVVACSSTSSPSGNDAGSPLTCASPGAATQGPADTHCNGVAPQPVDTASCHPDAAAAGDAGGASDGGATEACPYTATQFGQSGIDDDCKYKVSWTSDSICEGAAGVQLTLTLKSNVDGTPITGLPHGVVIEAFIPTDLSASCDDKSTHGTPGSANLIETTPGSGVYKGPVVFDAPGEWTVRFHIHEDCEDTLETSPHGHIAFHVTVP